MMAGSSSAGAGLEAPDRHTTGMANARATHGADAPAPKRPRTPLFPALRQALPGTAHLQPHPPVVLSSRSRAIRPLPALTRGAARLCPRAHGPPPSSASPNYNRDSVRSNPAQPAIIISPMAVRVVVIGWMGSKRMYLNKYANLWRRSGDHEVICLRPSVMMTLVRWRGVITAGGDIDKVARLHMECANMPTFYHIFSTGGFIHAGTMWRWMDEVEDVMLRRDMLEEVAGIILDSAPARVMPDTAASSHPTRTASRALLYGRNGTRENRGRVHAFAHPAVRVCARHERGEGSSWALDASSARVVLRRWLQPWGWHDMLCRSGHDSAVFSAVPGWAVRELQVVGGQILTERVTNLLAIVCAVTRCRAEDVDTRYTSAVAFTESVLRLWLDAPSVKLRAQEVYEAWYNMAPLCPQLYLYSESDPLVPSDEVEKYIKIQETRGVRISSHKYEDTGHCEHYRVYPHDYAFQISEFVAQSLAGWYERRA
ncbi:MAG: hypothetical protein WDW38_007682 [Sanguina aurantia]